MSLKRDFTTGDGFLKEINAKFGKGLSRNSTAERVLEALKVGNEDSSFGADDTYVLDLINDAEPVNPGDEYDYVFTTGDNIPVEDTVQAVLEAIPAEQYLEAIGISDEKSEEAGESVNLNVKVDSTIDFEGTVEATSENSLDFTESVSGDAYNVSVDPDEVHEGEYIVIVAPYEDGTDFDFEFEGTNESSDPLELLNSIDAGDYLQMVQTSIETGNTVTFEIVGAGVFQGTLSASVAGEADIEDINTHEYYILSYETDQESGDTTYEVVKEEPTYDFDVLVDSWGVDIIDTIQSYVEPGILTNIIGASASEDRTVSLRISQEGYEESNYIIGNLTATENTQEYSTSAGDYTVTDTDGWPDGPEGYLGKTYHIEIIEDPEASEPIAYVEEVQPEL